MKERKWRRIIQSLAFKTDSKFSGPGIDCGDGSVYYCARADSKSCLYS